MNQRIENSALMNELKSLEKRIKNEDLAIPLENEEMNESLSSIQYLLTILQDENNKIIDMMIDDAPTIKRSR